MALKRFNELMADREKSLREQQEKNQKKYEEIRKQLEKMQEIQAQKNQKTIERQKKIETAALKKIWTLLKN